MDKNLIIIIFILGIIFLSGCVQKKFGSLPMDRQIEYAIRVLDFRAQSQSKSHSAVNIGLLVGGHPEINTLTLHEVFPNTTYIKEDEIIFVCADSCNDLIVSEDKIVAKKRLFNIWLTYCGDPSKDKPKYYIVLGNTKVNVIKKCNEFLGIESKTCSELGGDICLGNCERCSGALLHQAVDTDRCCSIQCSPNNPKECAEIGGRLCCLETETCTEYKWTEKETGDRTRCCIGKCISR